MPGEKDLEKLISSMEPELSQEEYVFISLLEPEVILLKQSWAVLQEEEGTTLILRKELADNYQLVYESVFRRMTLKVHSSLEAVGLTAAVSKELAQEGISANVVAGFYHDHIFIQNNRAEEALAALQQLRERN